MKKPLISIIILNFNGLSDTFKCIQSIEKTIYQNYELLLVDNGSENNEGKKLKNRYSKKYKVTLLKNNLGFTGGNNRVLNRVKGKYIILLNNDTIVTPNWIEPLITLLEKDRSIAVVQPKIKMLQKQAYFDYAGAAGGFIDNYGYPFTKGRIFETKEKDTGQYNKEGVIFWASGAACIIRRSIIKRVGGLFDPIYFNYMEEIDFCWRVWKTGYKVYYCPDSVVYHKGAASAGKDLFKKRYWEHRNNLILLYKNLNNYEFRKTIIIRLLLETITYLHYLFTGNLTYIKSLFFAHKDFLYLMIKEGIQKNKSILLELSKPLKIPFFPSSIVIYYHLLKRDTFQKMNWSPKGNITYLVFNLKKSGGLKVIFEQANQFIEKGYFIKIYSVVGSKQNWYPLKIPIEPFYKVLFFRKINITIATFWPTSYLLFFIRTNNRYYLIQDWEESFYKNKIVKYFVRLSYKLPDKIITNNRFILNKIKKFNKNASVVKIHPINMDIFNNHKRPGCNKSNNKIRVISVISWYNQHKGIDIIDKIVQNIKRMYSNYEFTLVSYEKHKYSNNFDRFVSNANPLQMSKIYQNSDALLAASRNEGTLTTGLEAMACGCILFTTNSPGIVNYAKNGFNSIVVGNIESFWKNNIIQKTLANKKIIKCLRENGYKTAEKYSIKYIANPIEKIIFN